MNNFNFVFGYGSLVNTNNLEKYLGRKLTSDLNYKICGLNNFRRSWNVAMNNSLDLPDYKYYRCQITGHRPNGFVTFLNIRPSQNSHILGILFRVSNIELKGLDRRERNYHRINITSQIDHQVPGVVWTYIGLHDAEQRYQIGLRQGNGMIARDYASLVRDAYCSLGDRYLNNYIATTDLPKVPIIDLKRCLVTS